jgi:hypothetical protein
MLALNPKVVFVMSYPSRNPDKRKIDGRVSTKDAKRN